jgi:hypothetical protein
VLTTEHASHTASAWNALDSTSDDAYEASRLGSQLLWMASYGLSSYILIHFGVSSPSIQESENFAYKVCSLTSSTWNVDRRRMPILSFPSCTFAAQEL